jgi:acetylornithine deacetylase
LAFGAKDEAYDVASSTVHAGKMSGGIALNIVPDIATIAFEIRHLTVEPIGTILDRIRTAADAVVEACGHPAAAIEIAETNLYPGLDTPVDSDAVRIVAGLAGGSKTTKVAYGTEAGYFASLGIPTVVCGPGDMAQGHQPDEFIGVAELEACDAMIDRLIAELAR